MSKPFNSLSPSENQAIKQLFLDMEVIEDLHVLFGYVLNKLPLRSNEKTTYQYWLDLFTTQQYSPNYKYFTIKKASGKDRIIHNPDEILKLVQRLLNIILDCVFVNHETTFGFKKGSSIINNAEVHLQQNYVYNTDLADFFPSISFKRLVNSLGNSPFFLNGNRGNLAKYISWICCIKLRVPELRDGSISVVPRYVLPQGAPTSPILSNIVCYELDSQLRNLASNFKVNYSRYADDITFSSNKNQFKKGSKFLAILEQIVKAQNFKINHSKSRLQRRSSKQSVTGLVVNEKVNVDSSYIKSLRMYLHFWEKYGYSHAEYLFYNDNNLDFYNSDNKTLYSTIKGRLQFLRMVKGKDNLTYLKLKTRWDRLTLPSEQIIAERAQYFRVHKPKDVATFLRLFQNSPGLKYLTHDFDVPGIEFNYSKIMAFATKDFNVAFKKYIITRALYARIKQFAFTDKPLWWRWINGEKKEIDIGWSSIKMRNWVKDHPGVHPFRQKSFRDELITPFKESIQVRAPKLRQLLEDSLKEKFQEELGDVEVSYENLESANFYTDVDLILGGIRHLLDGILSRLDVSKKITLKFDRQEIGAEVLKIIEITHHNSFCYKNADSEEILSGNFIEAKKLFTGLCNWSITTKFNNGSFRLFLLKDEMDTPILQGIEELNISGFTNTLYFY